MTSQHHTHDLVGVDCCAACHDEKTRLQDALRPYPEPRPIKVTVHLDGRRESNRQPRERTEMDHAKTLSSERAGDLVAEYGPIATQVVVTLRQVPKEAYDSLMERFGPHPLDLNEPWNEAETIVTHTKHVDLGSGVLLNASWIEVPEAYRAGWTGKQNESKEAS